MIITNNVFTLTQFQNDNINDNLLLAIDKDSIDITNNKYYLINDDYNIQKQFIYDITQYYSQSNNKFIIPFSFFDNNLFLYDMYKDQKNHLSIVEFPNTQEDLSFFNFINTTENIYRLFLLNTDNSLYHQITISSGNELDNVYFGLRYIDQINKQNSITTDGKTLDVDIILNKKIIIPYDSSIQQYYNLPFLLIYINDLHTNTDTISLNFIFS